MQAVGPVQGPGGGPLGARPAGGLGRGLDPRPRGLDRDPAQGEPRARSRPAARSRGPTRPRWLDGGEQAEGRWDAYVAPAGCPLADLAGPEGLPWHDARPILEDLADELAAACAEGTLPPGLTVDQVWVQPDGRAILVDPLAIAEPRPRWPIRPARAAPTTSRGDGSGGRRCSCSAGRGAGPGRGPSPARRRLGPIRARSRSTPRPCSAGCSGADDAYPTVAAFRAELEATRHLPTEVNAGQRATNLVILRLFIGFFLFTCFFTVCNIITGGFGQVRASRSDGGLGPTRPLVQHVPDIFAAVSICSVTQATWMVLDFLTRGGLSLRFAGLALVRRDGRRAPRWR